MRDDLASSAQRLEGEFKTERPGEKASAAAGYLAESEALLASDPRLAMEKAIRAISADPAPGTHWLAFARAAIAVPPKDDSERYFLRDRALNAAYFAYVKLNDRDKEADAVALVGDIQAQQENWRGAINAYKAAIDLKPDPQRQAYYDRLVEERGFRVSSYTVDSDSLTPRACVEFSEPLKEETDFTSFVALSGGTGDNPSPRKARVSASTG